MGDRSLDDILNGARPRTAPPSPSDPIPDAEDYIDWEPEKDGDYKPFARKHNKWLTCLHVIHNADGRKSTGMGRQQFQYQHLESDGPGCGLAADGLSFVIRFSRSGMRSIQLTVHGRNLKKGWQNISYHQMPVIWAADRDFIAKDGDPIITDIKVEEIKDEC
jgi:hypothetical protein